MTRPPPPAPDGRGLPGGRHPVRPARSLRWGAVALISVGGALGALARYQVGLAWPAPPAGFPWSTLAVNVSGCLLLGTLLTVLSERPGPAPLLRPFLGTGVLGGYTTFSTYTVDLHGLLAAGRHDTAVVYLVGTVAGAIGGVVAGAGLARRLVRR